MENTLHQLARSGDVAGLRQLLDVNSLDDEGRTPLLCADFTKPEIVQLLLQHGANAWVQDSSGLSAMHLAVMSECVESVRMILDAGVDPNLLDAKNQSPLFIAVEGGMLSIAKMLLDRGADPDTHDRERVALGIAAAAGDESMVNLLLEHGADVGKKDSYKCSPLYYAARRTDTAISRRLIELGANVHDRGADGEMILHNAARHGHPEQVTLLLENGADAAARDEFPHTTALHCAVKQTEPQSVARRLQVMKSLIDSGADCNARDGEGCTPLHWAAGLANPEPVCYLLEQGADLRTKDCEGRTALHYAAWNKPCTKVLEFLLDQDGDHVKDRTETGLTALHLAAFWDADENCAVLLERGADVNAKCNEGRSPLFYAAKYAKKPASTIELLLRHGADATAESIVGAVMSRQGERADESTSIVLRHLAKIDFLNASSSQDARIGMENRCFIEMFKEAREYFDACKAELARMKLCKIFEDVSLLDILTKSEKIVKGYARNEDLVRGFEEKNSKDDFPNYAELTAQRFNEVVERQRKLAVAAAVLDGILRLTNDPGHIIYRKIFGYLNARDWDQLLATGDV